MNQAIPMYNTVLFCDVFDKDSDFLNEWKASGLYKDGLVEDDNIIYTFYLLYAKYGNNPIANNDVNMFKYKVWSIIFQYAPNWQMELKIQEKLRSLGLDDNSDIYKGAKSIYNHSYNPSSAPSTGSLEELTTIDDQNTTNYKRSKLEGLSALNDLLKTDVTESFTNRFKKLFKQFVAPERTYIFEDEN